MELATLASRMIATRNCFSGRTFYVTFCKVYEAIELDESEETARL
jgi:hypothetical protein